MTVSAVSSWFCERMGGCASKEPVALRHVALEQRGSAHAGVAAVASFDNGHARDEPIHAVARGTHDGEWISCSQAGSVVIADWQQRRVVHAWQAHRKGATRVVGAPRLDGAISAGRDTLIKLWRREEAEAKAELRGHQLTITGLALSPEGSTLCSGSRDNSVRTWDVASARSVAMCEVSRNVVTCMAWVRDEPLVLQGSEDLRLRLWDPRALSRPAATMEGYIYFPLACAAAGDFLLTGSNGFDGEGCELRLWDRRTMKQLIEMRGHQHAVMGVAMVPCGEGLVAASGSKDGEVRLWDVTTGTCIAQQVLPHGGASSMSEGSNAEIYVGGTTGEVHVLRAEGMPRSLMTVAIGFPQD